MTPPRTRGAGARVVLAQRNFRWFALSRIVSLAGSAMSGLALTFGVLHIGRREDLGLVLAVNALSMLVFILVGGVVADRFPRQAVVQVTHLVAGVSQGVMAWLLLTDRATIPWFVALGSVGSACAAFTMPALQGLLPQVTDRKYLQEANAVMSLARSAVSIGGPVVAGLLVATVGPGWAFAADSLSFFLAALSYTQVRLPRTPIPRSTMLRDLATGWTEFASRTWLWVIVVAFGFINAAWGAVLVVGPVVADATPGFGARGWGLCLAAMAAGTVVTTVALMHVRIERPLVVGMLACLTSTLPMLALALDAHWLVVAAGMLLVGLGFEVFGTGWNVAMQEHVPEEVLSRVFAYDFLGSFILGPLGLAFYGWAAGHLPLRPVLLATAAALAAFVLWPLLVPSVRNLRRAPHAEPRELG